MNLEKLIKEATEINPLEVMGRIEKLKKTKATDALSQQMIDMAVEELTGSIQKKALVDAVLNKDYSTLVKHRDMLGERGKDALLEMLEGEDIGKLYTLNKESGERFMKTRKPIDKGRTLSDVEMDEIIKNRGRLNSAIDDIGLEDNISAELEGMGPMDKGAFGNVIKDRLQADRFKRNQNVDMSIDEMFNNDFISNKDIENSPRFDKWKRAKEEELIAEAATAKNMDLRRQNKNRIASGYGRTFDDIGEIHERANRAPLSEVVDSDNIDYILDQFEEARDLERAKPTPRARDYGEETLYLKDAESGNKKPSLQERRKELIEAASRIKGEGRNVSIRKFSSAGKKEGYATKREKELLREMYPASKKSTEKIDPSKFYTKSEKPVTRAFINGMAKQNGFRFSEQMMERLLKMTRQQVTDYIDNISNPYVKPNKFVK